MADKQARPSMEPIMSKIHSIFMFCLFTFLLSSLVVAQTPTVSPASPTTILAGTLLASAVVPGVPAIAPPPPPPPVAGPILPAVKGPLLDGDSSINGNVQPVTAAYIAVDIYICVSDDKPKAQPDACNAPNNPLIAQQKNPGAGAAIVNSISSAGNDSFKTTLINPLVAGQYVYVTEVVTLAGGAGQQTFTSAAIPVISFSKTAPLGTAFAGLDITGASSTDPSPVFLGIGILDAPLSSGKFFSSRAWVGGQMRIAGMAQPTSLTLDPTSSIASYIETAASANPDSVVKSLEGSVNIAVQLFHYWKLSVDSFDVGDYHSAHLKSPSTIITLSALLSFGAITPFSASQANPAVYNLTSQIIQQYPQNPGSGFTYAPGCNPLPSTTSSSTSTSASSTSCYVSFLPTDRTHFYRNYAGGVRLKMYGGDYNHGKYRFPAIGDLTFGQNEYVSGGQLRHFVLHFGGVLPVPQVDGLYIFGSMDTELNKTGRDNPQLILTAATSTSTTPITYTSPSVTDIPVSQPNRDRYQIGFGVDLFHIIDILKKKSSSSSSTTPAAQ